MGIHFIPMAKHQSRLNIPISDFRLSPNAPKIICLGHAMKETLTANLALKAMELGLRLGGGEASATYCLSDGGDGFVEAMQYFYGGRVQRVITRDPIGRLHYSEYVLNSVDELAIIEAAKACGLALVEPERRNIMGSGTRGLADLIIHAVSYGARRICVGIGGSATCDGGVGMLTRLESVIKKTGETELFITAQHLPGIKTIDLPVIKEFLKDVEIIVYSDVTNPLLGPDGAAKVFAPQKGASPDQVKELEESMRQWADLVEASAGGSFRDLPGAGAAGGLGFALASIGGEIVSGADTLCQAIELGELLRESAGLITCEGKFDASSFHGKAPWIASQYAVANNKRAVIICGVADAEAVEQAREQGVEVIEVGRGLREQGRSAESFVRVQETVQGLVRSFR